jgi:hypothetical protein
MSRDTWQGDYNRPGSLNRWNYVEANPINLTDPSGLMASGNEVINFIVKRMREDSASDELRKIRELNNSHLYKDACAAFAEMPWWEKILVGRDKFLHDALIADQSAHTLATAQFGCLVSDSRSRPVCGKWDYKADIGPKWGEAQTVDFSSIGQGQIIFFYDIWANFHFGYLGLAGGFSEDELLHGAAKENAVSNLLPKIKDDPSDTVANIIGFNLYKSNNLSENSLLWWIWIYKDQLNKAIVVNGQIKETY